MRPIDADSFIEEARKRIDMQDLYLPVHIKEFVIDEMPTIDAVPVIRCKDCKHSYEKEWVVGGGSYTTCWYQTIANAQPNDFCSRAERKEE